MFFSVCAPNVGTMRTSEKDSKSSALPSDLPPIISEKTSLLALVLVVRIEFVDVLGFVVLVLLIVFEVVVNQRFAVVVLVVHCVVLLLVVVKFVSLTAIVTSAVSE